MNNRRLYRNGGPIGPLATITCEPRQARKGATVAGDSCAGVWLVGSPPSFFASAYNAIHPSSALP